MKYKKIKLLSIFLLGLCLTGLYTQTSVNTLGGNAVGSGGAISYTIGQVVYSINNGKVIQGVHQPYEISTVAGLEGVKGINLLVSGYPNPTTDYLTLEVKEFEISNLYFQLYDISGQLIKIQKITEGYTSIDMSNLISDNYLVKVVQGNKEIKIFKVIKI